MSVHSPSNRGFLLRAGHAIVCLSPGHGPSVTPPSLAVRSPFVWQDARGHFHALFHKFTDEHPNCGGHAFSADGASWTLHNDAAYTTTVTTADGTNHSFFRRERPHLLFDQSGER